MFPHISHIILVLGLSLLSCNPEKASGQTAAGLHNETLVITAYERLQELYIDGQPQSLENGYNWNLPDYIQLQPTNRLIAVYAANIADTQCAGVLASVSDGSFLTNNEWKCVPYQDANWEHLGYDDSSWDNAVEYGSNGEHSGCDQQQFIGNISSDSRWIWIDNLFEIIAYCRGYLPFCENSSPCLNNGACLKNDVRFCNCLPQFTGTLCETELYNETLVITAYEQLVELYIDGVQQQSIVNGNNWNQSDYIEVPSMGRLIALNAINNGDPICGGVLASIFEAYPLTNSNWKCTTSNGGNTDWIHLGYDDSSWSNAVEYGSNAYGHSGCAQMQNIVDIDPDARWIWTANPSSDLTVYCRGYLPFCETKSPCLNNGTCLENNATFCVCLPQYTGEFCETVLYDKLLTITAKSALFELYVDGVLRSLTYGNNWTVTDAVYLSPTNRLIGVMAADLTSTCAGVLASVTSGYLVSDAKWKCQIGAPDGWYSLGFDDSLWNDAYVIGYNNNVTSLEACTILTGISSISPDASWIWTPSILDAPYYDQIIYCRAYLPTCEQDSPCLNGGTCNRNNESMCSCSPRYGGTFCELNIQMSLTITAKTTLYELYIDGVPQSLSHATNVSAADEILLPSYGRLVAVTALDTTSTCAGILASVTGDYLVTDASWNCHTDSLPQWYTIGFDDTDWIDAYVIGPNNNVTWPEECGTLKGVASISENSYWIWTSSMVNTPDYDDIIYCRAYLPLCEQDSPCKNGGTCNRNSVILCTCLHDYTGVFCENEITRRLSITAKSTVHEFYIDGIKTNLIYNNNWTVADEIELSSVNRLISVLAVDSTSTCAGILASVTDDFMVTDASWKCRIGAPPQWYILGFDDSDWTYTYVIGPNANVTWPEQCKVLTEIPAISQNAYWIWTSTIPDVPYYDSIIYCRAYLPICEKVQPCRNGGTCRENSVNLCTCPIGFTGVYCEAVACNGDAPCQNGGTCIQGNAEPCLCPPEFTGTFCEFSSLTTDSITAAAMPVN